MTKRALLKLLDSAVDGMSSPCGQLLDCADCAWVLESCADWRKRCVFRKKYDAVRVAVSRLHNPGLAKELDAEKKRVKEANING